MLIVMMSYVDQLYDECRHVKCCYAECRCAEWLGSNNPQINIGLTIRLHLESFFNFSKVFLKIN